jgi:Glycosyl transferase family 2
MRGIATSCRSKGAGSLAEAPTESKRATVWPRVSVVVPCYNYGKWLRQCVESVFAQTNADIEVVIVNDASSDNSLEVARGLQSRDARVKVINNLRNKGHIPSVNEALGAVTGDYIVKLDADDLLPAGSLARSLTVMEANPSVGFVYGRCLSFGADLKQLTSSTQRWTRSPGLLMSEETRGVGVAQAKFAYRLWPGSEWLQLRCQPEVLIRASVMRDVGVYDEALPHTSDLAMWLALSARSDVAYIDGPIQGLYRVHSSSMQRTVNAGKLRDLAGRLAAFDSVLPRVSRFVPNAQDLIQVARKAIASQALDEACRAYERGRATEEPIERYEALAFEAYPDARTLHAWRLLEARRALRPETARWNPSCLSAVLKRRIREERNWRRWWNSGV